MDNENLNNKTKRTRCKSGTHWIDSAQKCMTTSEKEAFMAEKKKK